MGAISAGNHNFTGVYYFHERVCYYNDQNAQFVDGKPCGKGSKITGINPNTIIEGTGACYTSRYTDCIAQEAYYSWVISSKPATQSKFFYMGYVAGQKHHIIWEASVDKNGNVFVSYANLTRRLPPDGTYYVSRDYVAGSRCDYGCTCPYQTTECDSCGDYQHFVYSPDV